MKRPRDCHTEYLEIVILSEASQTGKEKYHMILLMCGIWGENGTNEPIYKT